MDNSSQFVAFCSEKCNSFKENWGFPDWAKTSCISCNINLDIKSIYEMSIHFNPMFLGDVSISYLCPSCNSLFVVHYKNDMKKLSDIQEFFNSKLTKQGILREDLINKNIHNVLEKNGNV